MKKSHHTTIPKANHTISVLDELLEGLPSRGALFPALKAIGQEDDGMRRGWTAINSGVWQTTTLIVRWSKHVIRNRLPSILITAH